jgi:hypothetical protein
VTIPKRIKRKSQDAEFNLGRIQATLIVRERKISYTLLCVVLEVRLTIGCRATQ